jgi:transketolase
VTSADTSSDPLMMRALCTAVFFRRGEGHLASCLSVCEILAELYSSFLNVRPANPRWPERDRVVMSKAHASLMYYTALALRGFFPREWLWSYNSFGSCLPLEPDPRLTPGVDVATGPLGTGLAKAVGIAVGLKRCDSPARVVVIMGDGEAQKGQVWEAVGYAAHVALDNLVVVVDANGRQLDGPVAKLSSVDLGAAFEAFGWAVHSVNGHHMADIGRALRSHDAGEGRPIVILAQTVKGKGIPVLEQDVLHHYFRRTEPELPLPAALDQIVTRLLYEPKDI